MKQYVEIGRIMGAHGVRGDLRVDPYNPESELFVPGGVVYLRENDAYRSFQITLVTGATRGLRLHLQGVETCEAAKALYRAELFYPRDAFAATTDNENYIIDLIGIDVFDADTGRRYGKLLEIIATAANDAYVVEDGGREIVFPATKDVIVEVDVKAGRMRVRPPEGLLDVYES
ncbi:MAG: 16S rRNA processing protein RimM [Myxococcales bacterium]|nr:MAG: 16S rRNA processing protein RimM [Myxococcales bacterium]